MFTIKEPVFVDLSDEEESEAEMPAIIKQGSAQDSDEADFDAQMQAAFDGDDDKESEEEVPSRKMSW